MLNEMLFFCSWSPGWVMQKNLMKSRKMNGWKSLITYISREQTWTALSWTTLSQVKTWWCLEAFNVCHILYQFGVECGTGWSGIKGCENFVIAFGFCSAKPNCSGVLLAADWQRIRDWAVLMEYRWHLWAWTLLLNDRENKVFSAVL